MTNSIRNSALLALVCIAFRLSCLSATSPGTPADAQDAAANASADNPTHGSVSILEEYACKKGTHKKSEREGLVSVVMQRGADTQPGRVFGVKDSKTGEVAFVYVLDSDCSGEQPVAAPGASLALAHKISGGEEYFYAISSQGECLRAYQMKFLGQFVEVDMSTRIQDCQKEIQIWSGQAARWNAQANSAGKAKP
jgi:hypothetical protein